LSCSPGEEIDRKSDELRKRLFFRRRNLTLTLIKENVAFSNIRLIKKRDFYSVFIRLTCFSNSSIPLSNLCSVLEIKEYEPVQQELR
jgi:hypothetical protein